ncbi:MAG TPA: LCP family protein [Solirubrobacteraceae bacterium]|nr:LCP family protein [Solirubrobacteraceae bacterium]
MADDFDPEPPGYERYRAPRHLPWHQRLDAEAGLEELRALNAGTEADAAGRWRWGVPGLGRRRRRRRLRRRRPRWLRAIRWAITALFAWILLSVVLFIASSLSASGVPASAVAALSGGGLPPLSATTILVLGSDARPAGSKEPGADVGGPSRSDVMMLVRTGGGHSGRLSIPRDTLVDVPGHGFGKINSAYYYGGPALAIKTVDQFLGIKINHVLLINFTNFPKLVDAMGGVNYTGSCVVSFISGGFRDGGYTLRLQSGTHHLNGAQALALARTRHNQCNPNETDLTREIRQQKLLLDMKSQMLSLSGFIRMPWIAWALPQTLETDMGAPTLAGVLASMELDGNAKTALLEPTGAEVYNGEDVLTITDAAKRADVERFLNS